MVKKAIQHISAWYQRNFSWKGAFALSFFLVKEIPSWVGRQAFWSRNLPVIWKFIYAHSTIITVLVVGLFIWLDHRMALRRQAQRYDLRTLKGRTLKFCDDLEKFKAELGPEPEIKWKRGDSPEEFTKANEPMIIREQKMHHGFHLRFADAAWKLWHEHGAEKREDESLKNVLSGRLDSNERLTPVIERFRELA